jgi:hypothetical protein
MTTPENDDGQRLEGRASGVNDNDTHAVPPSDEYLADDCATCDRGGSEGRYASLVIRCAWLRAHADLLLDFDRTGQLSADLRDFADLLEVADRLRWFG